MYSLTHTDVTDRKDTLLL